MTASLVFLAGAALLGGFLDAIVGGGGLIVVPALFSALPSIPPASVLGTSKGGSFFGLASSCTRYRHVVALPWRSLLPLMLTGFLAAAAGAWIIRVVPATFVRPIIPVVLALVLISSLLHRYPGRPASIVLTPARRAVAVALLAAASFYDGFLGPGAGTMMLVVFLRLYRFDFLRAAAHAKFLNLATNGGALLVLALSDHVLWRFAVVLAATSILGAQLGARLAIARGSGFVRVCFIVASGSLIAKTAFDAWVRG
ncbi:MAG: TSUP family transporter [Acetobacteraceae bacterium]|nr:TSUP family transporter [Acetobacteraceae bacterium]